MDRRDSEKAAQYPHVQEPRRLCRAGERTDEGGDIVRALRRPRYRRNTAWGLGDVGDVVACPDARVRRPASSELPLALSHYIVPNVPTSPRGK